jgi:quinol monooxygenase YgiN
MIMLTGRFEIDAAQRESFLQFARGLVESTRREPGCLNYDIFEDISTANHFLVMEEWEDARSFDAHTDTLMFDVNDRKLGEFIVGEPTWDEYEF